MTQIKLQQHHNTQTHTQNQEYKPNKQTTKAKQPKNKRKIIIKKNDYKKSQGFIAVVCLFL